MFNSHLVDPHPLPTHPRFAGAVVNNERVGPGDPFSSHIAEVNGLNLESRTTLIFFVRFLL